MNLQFFRFKHNVSRSKSLLLVHDVVVLCDDDDDNLSPNADEILASWTILLIVNC
jgi:hypothetical protein